MFPYLCLRQHERRGHLKALGSGEILVLLELLFQLEKLLTGESRPGPSRLPQDGGVLVTCSRRNNTREVCGQFLWASFEVGRCVKNS